MAVRRQLPAMVRDARFAQARTLLEAVWRDMSMVNPNIHEIAQQTKIRWQNEIQFASELLGELERELEHVEEVVEGDAA